MPDKNRWEPARRAEIDFERELVKAITQVFEGESVLNPPSTLPEWFEQWAWRAATRMITYRATENARNWRAAARESGQGRRIYELLQRELRDKPAYHQLIRENAVLIRSLPLQIAEAVTARAARGYEGGRRSGVLENELLAEQRYAIRWKARQVARTETAKAAAALTRTQATEVNVDWYGWETSRDQRVRPAHKLMQGVLCRFSEPPNPEQLAGEPSTLGSYMAGATVNCRCYADPAISLATIRWPHKVHFQQSIHTMGISDFRETFQISEAA